MPAARAGGGRVQAMEVVDAREHLLRQPLDLIRLVVGRAEGVVDLLLAQLREDVAEPLRLLDGDVVEETLILAVVVEASAVALDLLDEARADLLLRLVAAVRDRPAGLAEGRAEVADDVAQLALPVALARRV